MHSTKIKLMVLVKYINVYSVIMYINNELHTSTVKNICKNLWEESLRIREINVWALKIMWWESQQRLPVFVSLWKTSQLAGNWKSSGQEVPEVGVHTLSVSSRSIMSLSSLSEEEKLRVWDFYRRKPVLYWVLLGLKATNFII